MRSRSAVFQNRFVVVYPFIDPSDPSTIESNHAEVTRRTREERKRAKQEQENRMKLIQERQDILVQEIATVKTTLTKRMEILKKYAAKARSLPEDQRPAFQTSIAKAMTGVYQDVDMLYTALTTSRNAVQTTEKRTSAEEEV